MNLNITQLILLLDIYSGKFKNSRHNNLEKDIEVLRARKYIVDHKELTDEGNTLVINLLKLTEN